MTTVQPDRELEVARWYALIEEVAGSPVGKLSGTADEEQARRPARELGQLLRAHFQLAVGTARYREVLSGAEQEAFRSDLSATILDLFGAVDAAEAGRTVTAFSVGTNALRPDAERFREISDDLIARYLTTGQYHESHEAFVTMSILAEQWLRAMADATTEQHDILDDAVSSNTRIVANLCRGLSYYAQRIAHLPESSYANVADVFSADADPREFGRLVTAMLVIGNRAHAARAGTSHQGAFWSGVDPGVLKDAIVNAADAAGRGLARNPSVGRALRKGLRTAAWTAVRELLRPSWFHPLERKSVADYVNETVFEAPRAVVYNLLADRERYGEFLPFTSTLLSPGVTERQGVGAVHRIGMGPVGVREEIVELIDGERIQYRVVGGLPVRSHVGTITLADHPAGTAVRYSMESTPLVPVPNVVMKWILRRSMLSIVDGARIEAVRRSVSS